MLGKAKEGNLESLMPLGHSDELLTTLGGHQRALQAIMGVRGGARRGARGACTTKYCTALNF